MNEIDLEYEQSIRDDVANGRFVSWMPMLWRRYLSEEFILEFINRFSIAHIFCYQNLSIDTIEKIIDNNNIELNDWENLSYYQKLTASFAKKYEHKLDWQLISSNRNLSLNFFRKFSDKLNWDNFCYYHKLSKKFAKEFYNKIYAKNVPWCFLDYNNERGWKTFL